MKIESLTIEGFRSLKHIEWKPGNLNVVIGPNASGKSNLLSALEFISASSKGKLGDYISASGGMEPLIWNDEASRISFSIRVASDQNSRFSQPDEYIVELERRGKTNNYYVVSEYVNSFDSDVQEMHGTRRLLTRNTDEGVFLSERTDDFEAITEGFRDGETFLSFLATPFGSNQRLLSLARYLQDWKSYNVYTHRISTVRQSVVTRYEKHLDSDGQNLATVLHTLYTNEREFRSEVDLGMRAAFGEEFEEVVFLPSASQRIELGIRWKSLRNVQTAANLSDGTLRFLILLTILADPNPAPLIAIEEPETGLHPGMLPIVAEFAEDAARRAQVIFTTHSEAFLDAFKDKRPMTTVIGLEDGETTLSVVDDEELAHWLKDFTLGEIFRSGTLEIIAS